MWVETGAEASHGCTSPFILLSSFLWATSCLRQLAFLGRSGHPETGTFWDRVAHSFLSNVSLITSREIVSLFSRIRVRSESAYLSLRPHTDHTKIGIFDRNPYNWQVVTLHSIDNSHPPQPLNFRYQSQGRYQRPTQSFALEARTCLFYLFVWGSRSRVSTLFDIFLVTATRDKKNWFLNKLKG